MNMTRQKLIQKRAKINQDDPDLEFNAIAGHIELKNGMFIDWDTFICRKKFSKIKLKKRIIK